MARLEISALTKDVVISQEEMRRLKGGPNRRAYDTNGVPYIKVEGSPPLGDVALSEPALVDPFIKWE